MLRPYKLMSYDMLLFGNVAIIASQTLPIAAELHMPRDKASAVKRGPFTANAAKLHLPGHIQLSKSFQKILPGYGTLRRDELAGILSDAGQQVPAGRDLLHHLF